MPRWQSRSRTFDHQERVTSDATKTCGSTIFLATSLVRATLIADAPVGAATFLRAREFPVNLEGELKYLTLTRLV